MRGGDRKTACLEPLWSLPIVESVATRILTLRSQDQEGLEVNELPTGRVIRGILLLSALLLCAAPVRAADPAGAVAPPHGPMLMIYVTQPIGSRGASRIYGLRLEQVARQPTLLSAPPTTFYAASPQRSLVDLQLRRQADVRIEFGHRLTWDVRRWEFALPGARPPKAIEFIARSR
jgi:hypothetical protein